MTNEEIMKAFENRWRIKSGRVIESNRGQEPITYEVLRKFCLDFFKTGILIGEMNNESFTEGVTNGYIVSESELVCTNTFDDFWNLYDKKVGRPKCEKLWEKLSKSEREECMSYIPAYKQAQPDKQYRKNPETFLRNKSWHDEIITRNYGNSTNDKLTKLADILAG